MSWEHRADLRADPARAPGERNIEAAAAKRRSIWPSIAVAAAAAAFGGVIWFAYQNGRDATHGGPPLIRAEPGPVKVKPENPGGQEIPFQDSTVYDRLEQTGQKPVVEKLLPPPEAPVERPTSPPPSPAGPATADIGSPTALAPAPGAIIIAPAPAAKPPAPAAQPSAPAAAQAAPPAQAPPALAPPAQAPPRAGGDAIAALIASQSAPSKPDAGGAFRVRLSAVRSLDAVAPEWARLKRRFPELGNLKSSFSKIDQPGKGVFYRVEAGPFDAAGAKSTCEHLRAQGLGCIVVKP